ncbi:MAG: CopD family protein [Bacteroidetes bacterium]|nr:CopD family protein [Bacteroidota bacterium]MBK8659120.1 CopD family protein [Bacteroidota bacterium]
MTLKYLILLHTLCACIWVGGHLVLALSVLPKALKKKEPEIVREFESHYERVGIPALLLQVVTGVMIAVIYMPVSEWFTFQDRVHTHIGIKLILLFVTFALAVHARLFIIPKLSRHNLALLAWHIAAVTAIAVLMLFIGLNFRLAII